MENINNYKKRFFNLMESTMGDVKPLIMEESSELSNLNAILSQANLGQVSQEDVPELVSDCPIYAPNESAQGYLDQVKQAAESADLNTLKSELKKVSLAKDSNKIQEQDVTDFMTVFGIRIPTIEFVLIAGGIIIAILVSIAKRIFGEEEKSKGKAYCEKSNTKLLSKLGVS
jgi:hypothetical protein